ncbi:MAG: hypothetical protein PHE20_02510 [Patescibacteria group bacterium]|nr:hypothetical protein [Patescibacteria group bacterium]
MKKKNIITTSVLSLTIIALAAGFAFNAYAQTEDATALGTMFRGGNSEQRVNLTDEQKIDMEARRSEMDATREEHQAAMQMALNSGNYDTWVQTTTSQMGADARILTQVNANNFSQFVEAHQLITQAQDKFAALGIDRGFGEGAGHGMGRGLHRGLKGSANLK